MRTTLVWLFLGFAVVLHLLTVAYAPLPRVAEVVYAHQLYGQGALQTTSPLDLPQFQFSPLAQKWSLLFTDADSPSLFRFRLGSVVAGLLLTWLTYLVSKRGALRQQYAHALLLLLCIEPGMVLLLRNGLPDALALACIMASAWLIMRQSSDSIVVYLVAGAVAGLAPLVSLPYVWLVIALVVWQASRTLVRWQQRSAWLTLGALILGAGSTTFYQVWGGAMSLQDWTVAWHHWHMPRPQPVNMGIFANTRFTIFPWHYVLLATSLIAAVLYLVRAGLTLFPMPRLPLLALMMMATHFWFVEPQTGVMMGVLPWVYLLVIYLFDYLQSSIGPAFAQPMAGMLFISNGIVAIMSTGLVLTSIGGRDYAMVDYELGQFKKQFQSSSGPKLDLVVADARYYYSIAKQQLPFMLHLPGDSIAPELVQQQGNGKVALVLHEDFAKRFPEAQQHLEDNFIVSKQVAKLRSYIDMPYLKRDDYGWLAQRNQAWQMNYDGAIFLLGSKPGKRQ